MIILIAVFLFVAALLLFLSTKLSIWLALPALTAPSFQLGAILLLSSFTLLFLAGLALFVKQALRTVFNYFSSTQRIRRRSLFVKNRRDQIHGLLPFKIQQIKHYHDLAKSRLSKADDQRHIQSLSKAVYQDLLAHKKKLPAATFRQLQREHAYYRAHSNGEALSKLQQKIAELV